MAKTKKTKSTTGKQTASDFIRAQAANMKAADVVEAGKKAGFPKISTGLVYMVRSRLSKTSGQAPKKRGRPRKDAAAPSTAPQAASSRSASPEERELARAILNVGFDRARAVFVKLEALLG